MVVGFNKQVSPSRNHDNRSTVKNGGGTHIANVRHAVRVTDNETVR